MGYFGAAIAMVKVEACGHITTQRVCGSGWMSCEDSTRTRGLVLRSYLGEQSQNAERRDVCAFCELCGNRACSIFSLLATVMRIVKSDTRVWNQLWTCSGFSCVD